KSLPRRTVLRGIGATLALPFLEAMVPSAKAAGKAAHRFQTFYVPNGMAMEYWSPKGEGTNFEFSPILEPLAPFRDQLLVLSGLKRGLGAQDQTKVDEYTEAIRGVGRRIQRAEEQGDVPLPAMEAPQGVPAIFEDHLALMLDLQLLAFQSDLTRVISFMIGK